MTFDRVAKEGEARDPVLADWSWVQANRDWLENRYASKWIAVAGQQIVGSGTKLRTALKQTAQRGVHQPFITAFKRAEYRDMPEVPQL